MNRICWPCVLIIALMGLIYHLFFSTPASSHPGLSAQEVCELKLSKGNCIYALR